MTQVFLTPPDFNVHTWPDPGNWNQIANTVECVGTGGNGASTGNFNGGGGGGGAYAVGRNMTLTFPVSYSVGLANGNATNFNTTSQLFVNSGNVVSASAGFSGNSSSGGGGSAGTGFYPSGFAGGVGGNSPGGAGGGGGAGGPHGAGAAGVNATTVSGAGGAGDGGTVPGGAVGAPGNSGTQWDASHGIGSGAGGGAGGAAGTGGNYGGGGGGSNSAAQGPGAQGIIVITYAPLYSTQIGVVRYWQTSAPTVKHMWMTIIPTYDSELDNPAWTTNILTGVTGWSFDMVRISQAQYLSYANFAAFQSAILAM